MENMYVLSRKDPFFGDVLFYVECKSDTTNISKATRFSLDEAMKRASFFQFSGRVGGFSESCQGKRR